MGRLSEANKKLLLDLKPDDITYELGMKLFADTMVKGEDGKMQFKKSLMEPTDTFFLKANEYFNKTDIETTAGRFIFNKFIIEPNFSKHMDYVNKTIDNGGLGDIESQLSIMLLTDVITTEQFGDYLNRIQWLGMQFHEPMAASFTLKGMKPIDKVIKRRDELIEENKEALDKGDIFTMTKIEKELVKLAEQELGNDPSMDLYNSGARGSVSNNYKQLSIVKGPVLNHTTGKYEFIKSNFFEGVKKEDISAFASNVTNGAYPKACLTAVSGYKSKQVNAAFQAVVLRKDVEDCGSTGYVEILLTKKRKNQLLYRYIIEGGKKVLLTPEEYDKRVGKICKFRTIMFCTCDDGVCLSCAGRAYEKLGIDNVGMTASQMTGDMLNLKMKSFHDTSVKIHEIDLKTMTSNA